MDKAIVYEDKRIEIIWKYGEELEKVIMRTLKGEYKATKILTCFIITQP